MIAPYLVGERIYTRPLTPEDIASTSYLAWVNDPQVRRHIGSGHFPVTREAIEAFCRKKLSSPCDAFMAVVDKSTDRHIGNAGIINIAWTDRCGEISTLIGEREYWGRGYFSEIVGLLSEYSFNELNLSKIWSGGSNPAVYVTLKQLGWTMEGILRNHRYIDGRYQDVVIMCLFRDQYQPPEPQHKEQS